MLDDYKKDKEILSYLDRVNVEDEKDIYDTLQPDSFILKVRPAFYKVFELEADKLAILVETYPLERWALVLLNSSRSYIRLVSERLDDKKKMVLSTHLKRLDLAGVNAQEQNIWKGIIAKEAQKYLAPQLIQTISLEQGAESESQRHSA
jgi:hypothetical protein